MPTTQAATLKPIPMGPKICSVTSTAQSQKVTCLKIQIGAPSPMGTKKWPSVMPSLKVTVNKNGSTSTTDDETYCNKK